MKNERINERKKYEEGGGFEVGNKQTDTQTPKQTDKPNLYIDIRRGYYALLRILKEGRRNM